MALLPEGLPRPHNNSGYAVSVGQACVQIVNATTANRFPGFRRISQRDELKRSRQVINRGPLTSDEEPARNEATTSLTGDAVRAQPDMELVGIGDVVTDYRVKTAVGQQIPVFASIADKACEMKAAGVPIAGTLDDLLAQVDAVVDATPKGIGARNLERYRETGVKAIFQGGEKHSLTGH